MHAAKRPNHSAISRDGKCVQFSRPRIIVATKPEMHLWNVASLPKSESRRPPSCTAPVSGNRSRMPEFRSPSSVGDWCCVLMISAPIYAAQWDAPAVLTLTVGTTSSRLLFSAITLPNSSSSSFPRSPFYYSFCVLAVLGDLEKLMAF